MAEHESSDSGPLSILLPVSRRGGHSVHTRERDAFKAQTQGWMRVRTVMLSSADHMPEILRGSRLPSVDTVAPSCNHQLV